MGTAYFGHALLAELLLPKLKASAPARIVWMSGALESQANVRWDDLGCAWDAAAAGACIVVTAILKFGPGHATAWQRRAWMT